MNKIAPEPAQTDAIDTNNVDRYWDSRIASIGEGFGPFAFPQVHMDWNFPLNIEYIE
jgi:hypothetical protein